MRYLSCLMPVALASGLSAAEPMSASEFESYTTGKTLYYGQSNAPYGAEIYMENRRVKWSFLDGECEDGECKAQCKEGHWYPQGEEICFVYEDRPEEPQCWVFFLESGGLVAEFRGNPGLPELYEAHDLGQELLCLGPEVGV